jgi:GAF domain-containing protein
VSPLSESLAELSQFFVGDRSVKQTLERIASLTVEAVPPVRFAGLTMTVEGRERTAVFTDPESPEIDQAQYDAGDGPCLAAMREQQIHLIDSTRKPGRWQPFRDKALAHGILSTLSLPLVVKHAPLGALNLYSERENGFDAGDVENAAQFSLQAAVVLANANAYWDAHGLSERLNDAAEHRAIIEQAKGMLIGAQGCTGDEAFQLLVKASQRENIKVRDLAQRMVDRRVDGGPPPRSIRPQST